MTSYRTSCGRLRWLFAIVLLVAMLALGVYREWRIWTQ